MNSKTNPDHGKQGFNAVGSRQPAFAWQLNAADVRSFNERKMFIADEARRAELAVHLGLSDLTRFQLNVMLKAKKTAGVVELTCTLHASGEQACVVSGEPVAFRKKLHEIRLFTTQAQHSGTPKKTSANKTGQNQTNAEQPTARGTNHAANHHHQGYRLEACDFDRPEVLPDTTLDILRVGIEILSLNLDPFPRKPGAALHAGDADKQDANEQTGDRSKGSSEEMPRSEAGIPKAGIPESGKQNPFAKLQPLKNKLSA